MSNAGAVASTANTTHVWTMIGNLFNQSTESDTSRTYLKSAGTLSNIMVTISANSTPTATTWTSRKNGAAGSQTFSVSGTATGAFSDPTNTDTVAAGDKFGLQAVPPATGTYSVTSAGALYEATTDTVTRLVCRSNTTFGVASVTQYNCLQGNATFLLTTENNAKVKQKKAGTMRNLYCFISANARVTSASTIRVRKNGANGNMLLSIATSQTGIIEEGSPSSDTVAVDDDFNFSITTGAGTEAMSLRHVGVEFVSTANYGETVLAHHSLSPTTVTDATIVFDAIGGQMNHLSTELGTQSLAGAAFTYSNLTCWVTQNGISTATPITLRKNGVDTTLVCSCTGSTTGIFTDAVHTETVAATDKVCYEIAAPSVGGTQTIAFQWISMWTTIAAAPNNVERALPTETVTVSD